MKTGTAHAKFILTCSVQLNPRGVQVGRDFISKIIELAIQDKSKKVKQFGALRANSYDFYEYAALIKLELDKATDSKVIETLSYCYELLTKGYIIDKPDTDTRTWITYNGGGFPLDEEINDPEELHTFILERLKNNPRIQYLYNI